MINCIVILCTRLLDETALENISIIKKMNIYKIYNSVFFTVQLSIANCRLADSKTTINVFRSSFRLQIFLQQSLQHGEYLQQHRNIMKVPGNKTNRIAIYRLHSFMQPMRLHQKNIGTIWLYRYCANKK